ncbi:hypothetical protein [Aquaticitalea lipolytica]|uniref:hypothetical protein n=1 Tax=Aquaticitalea lipolytica TaxID=1247562 RepID=UPI00166C73A7|nr:hypothetical protein [Aquaticitalea lipolytica]
MSNISIVFYINQNIAEYTYSNEKGMYNVNVSNLKNLDTLKIVANGLGYKSNIKEIIYKGQRELTNNITLEEKPEALKEVVLEAWEKIKVSKDTVTFRASKFTDGSVEVVEDLLKKIPGVEVLKNGEIEVNGKPIDKLLIEGDDLFDDKYKILSKNLDANNISKVQVLNNFEDNPVLKSFQESEKVALNLMLKEDKKNVWFGNINIGLGTNERYEGSANLGLLKKKVKFFNFTNINNTRKLAIPQVRSNSTITISKYQAEKKIEKNNNTIVNIDNLTNTNFSDNEDVFNNSFLNSLSFVTNLSENTKLRSLSYYSSDIIDKQNSSFVEYFVSPEPIEYSEENNINIKDIIFATELEIKHYNNKTYYKYDFSFENNSTLKDGNLIFNENVINQEQEDNKHNFFNHLNVTKKLSENNLLLVYLYHGQNNTKQNLTIHPNIFNQQFEEEDTQSLVQQNSNSPLRYTGISTELITKLKKSEFGLEIFGNYDHDKINSTFLVNNQVSVDSLANDTDYKKTNLSARVRYKYDFSDKFKLRSSLVISQNYTNLNNRKEDFFFVNPAISFTYKKKQSVLGLNYSFTNNIPEISYLNENYILKNYRTFSRGLDFIEPFKSHNIGFRYVYKNYKKIFLINSYLFYNFTNRNYGTENFITENSNFIDYKILDGGSLLGYNISITKYLSSLPFLIKFSTNQLWSNNDVLINNEFGITKNYNANYQFKCTTYLDIPLDFDLSFKYNYSKGQFSDQENSFDYLEASLNSILELSEKWKIQITNDFYYINKNNFLFTNMKINFSPNGNRWSYQLQGSNLSNIKDLTNINISENQKRSSSFRIVPRYILLNLKYRF